MNVAKKLSTCSTRDEKLSLLNSLKYHTCFIDSDSGFSVCITQLSIVGKGKTPDEAYEMLAEQKAKYFKEMIDSDFESEIVLPDGRLAPLELSGFKRFSMKAGVVLYQSGLIL